MELVLDHVIETFKKLNVVVSNAPILSYLKIEIIPTLVMA